MAAHRYGNLRDNLSSSFSQAELSKMERAVRLSIALMVLAAITATVPAADVDWKMYGGASVSEPEICFYDA
jgi:hypothetical protein